MNFSDQPPSPARSSTLLAPEVVELLGPGLTNRVRLAALLAATLAPHGSGALSGEWLARELGLSRAAVHKHVEQLRSLGFAVEAVIKAGYRLREPFADLVAAEAVLPYLLGLVGSRRERGVASVRGPAGKGQGSAFTFASGLADRQTDSSAVVLKTGVPLVGLPYHYLSECESTNLVARRSAATWPAGSVLVTERQTVGRGRLNRKWVSEPGKDLTFSVLVCPAVAPAQAQLVSLAAAVAVAEGLEEECGLRGRVGLKWPNDVLLEGRKACGILVEGAMDADRLHWAVVGVGLNVNGQASQFPRAGGGDVSEWEGRPQPVAVAEVLGHPVERAPLLAALLRRLGAWIGGRESLMGAVSAWRGRDVLLGREIEVIDGRGEVVTRGVAAGLGPEGQLLVRDSARPRASEVQVFAGDVRVQGLTGRQPSTSG